MPLLKVIFALNMLSAKAICYGIHQLHWNLQFHKQDATHPLQVAITCRMYVILRLEPPCSVHKHELYMLDSTAT